MSELAKNKDNIKSIKNRNPNLVFINDTLYSRDKESVYFYLGDAERFEIKAENRRLMPYALAGTKVKDVRIDKTTTHAIYEYSLACPIETINIPKSVHFQNDYAFGTGEQLREIHFEGDAPDVELTASNEKLYYRNLKNGTSFTIYTTSFNSSNSLPNNYCSYVVNLRCSREDFVSSNKGILDFYGDKVEWGESITIRDKDLNNNDASITYNFDCKD